MKIVFNKYLIIVLMLLGCMAAIERASAMPQDADLLYRAKCTACHRLYPARNYTYQKLQAYTDRYGKGLNDEERRGLLDYFKENAKCADQFQ